MGLARSGSQLCAPHFDKSHTGRRHDPCASRPQESNLGPTPTAIHRLQFRQLRAPPGGKTQSMDLISTLNAEGGAMRSSAALALGFSDHTVRVHVKAGRVLSPRRCWLALASLPPELWFTLTNGVLLTCITAAAKKGLWVLGHDVPHVSARAGRHVHQINARVHRRSRV